MPDRIGPMRHRATFQRDDSEADAYGNVTQGNWSNLATVWAELRPERGRERIEAGRLEASVAGTLRVRSTTTTRAVTEADRVTVDGEMYNIRAIVNPDQRGRFLELTVERGVAT